MATGCAKLSSLKFCGESLLALGGGQLPICLSAES